MKNRIKRVLAFVLSFAMIAALGLNATSTESQAAKKKYVKSMTLSKKSVSLKVGSKQKVTAKLKISGKASKKIKVAKVANKAIATAKVKGTTITITGKKAGKTKVTITSAGKNKKGKKISKTIAVNVKAAGTLPVTPSTTPAPAQTAAPVVAPTIVTLNRTNITLTQTESVKLIASVIPTTTAVVWSSSNPAVASVDNAGNVKAIGVGKAEIVATAGSAKATCVVNVVMKKYTVTAVSAVNTDKGTITVTFSEVANKSVLSGTTITISNANVKVNATFKELSEDGKSAVYVIAPSDLAKLQNGNYVVQSDNMTIPADKGSTNARVDITGSSVKGIVYYKSYGDDVYKLPNASVTINGETAYTDDNGFYQLGLNGDKYTATYKANGFFDEKKEDVTVAANKTTAYNVGMELYNVEKVFIYGAVTDADASSTVIENAKVSLYEIKDGKETLKAETTTDSQGKYVFANSNANYSDINVNSSSVRKFSYGYGLDQNCEYYIEITKGVSSDNLFNVYDKYQTQDFDLGSARAIDKSAQMKKVKAISEMTMQLNWDTTLKSKGDVDVTLLDTDGRTVLCENQMTIDDKFFADDNRQEMKAGAYKLVDAKFFSNESNVKPTLPKGTYYLVCKSLDETGNVIDSIVVCPVSVTPGEGANAKAATITKAVERDINYMTSFSDDYGTTSKKNQGSVLQTVSDSEGTLSGSPVSFDASVYQIVDGVKVLINDQISNRNFEKNENSYISTYKQLNLAADTSYYVEAEKTHIVNGDKAFSTDNTDVWNVQFTAAANVINVRFENADRFIDQLNDNNTASQGEYIYLNSITINVDPANSKQSKVSKTIPIEKEYAIGQLASSGIYIDNEDVKGLPVGKYTVKFNFENYKLDTEYANDTEETVIDLQDAQLVCDAKYEKVYPTTISGVVAYKDTSKEMSDNGIAVLYSSDLKKIVAAAQFDKVDGQVTYKLEDMNNGDFEGGDYKLLIRGEGIDYQMKDVSVAKNEVKQNFDFRDLEVGGSTYMKPSIKTTSGLGLDYTASVVAYDKYYIDPWDENVSDNAFYDLIDSNYDGSFELERTGSSDTAWVGANMSKGDYKLVVDSELTDIKIFDVTLKSTYEDELIVNFTVYDNLVRINLTLSNAESSNGMGDLAYYNGQVDYITAESVDGSVFYDGVSVRDSVTNDSGSFYVPKGKAYVIKVYSHNNVVGVSATLTAQYNDTESVDITCRAVHQ